MGALCANCFKQEEDSDTDSDFDEDQTLKHHDSVPIRIKHMKDQKNPSRNEIITQTMEINLDQQNNLEDGYQLESLQQGMNQNIKKSKEITISNEVKSTYNSTYQVQNNK